MAVQGVAGSTWWISVAGHYAHACDSSNSAWIGVAGGDLDIAEVDSSVETGRERFTNRVEYASSQDDRCGSLPSSLPL